METIDALVALVIIFAVMTAHIVQRFWVPILALGLPFVTFLLWAWRAERKCPKCSSRNTRDHSLFHRSGAVQCDSKIVTDEQGNLCFERYNRVCGDCQHSWLVTDPDIIDRRPVRTQILSKNWRNVARTHAEKGATFPD